VGSAVVQDHVQNQVSGEAKVEMRQELQELLIPPAPVALADDHARNCPSARPYAARVRAFARSNALPAGFVQRAKIVVPLADGVSARAVETKLDVSRPTIAK